MAKATQRRYRRTTAAAPNGARRLQRGFIVSAEVMLVATILVLGTVVGWISIRDAATAELFDVANALEHAIRMPYFSKPDRGAEAPEEPDEQAFGFCTPSLEEGGECILE